MGTGWGGHHEDLNFENIDILEDELRRSSNNNVQYGNEGGAGLI